MKNKPKCEKCQRPIVLKADFIGKIICECGFETWVIPPPVKKQIIKINTEPELPLVKIGDIVQFDSLEPVKAVKFTDCSKCEYGDGCGNVFKYCDFIRDNGVIADGTAIMFKAIKVKE